MTDEEDLSFCGIESSEKHLTLHPAIVQYDSECNICPDNDDCVTTKYLSPGVELTLTCWTNQGSAVLGNTYVNLRRDFPLHACFPTSRLLANFDNERKSSPRQIRNLD
jgi:hypothetical protein